MLQEKEKIIITYPSSRRGFIKGMIGTSLVITIPFVDSCQANHLVNDGQLGKMSQMASDILDILFPYKGNGPSSQKINAYQYLNWILTDENYDKDIKNSLLKGFSKLDEFTKTIFSNPFESLPQNKQKNIILKIQKTSWGEHLISRLLSIILDALVIDPIYGYNTNGIGWTWLQHIPGRPRPTPQNKYPKILDRKKELVIISDLKHL